MRKKMKFSYVLMRSPETTTEPMVAMTATGIMYARRSARVGFQLFMKLVVIVSKDMAAP